MQKAIIFEVLGRFQEYFGKKLTPEMQATYIEHLENMNEDKFKLASINLIKSFEPTTAKPFPLIGDFLKACGEDLETKSINIVSLVRKKAEDAYQSIDFGDRHLHSVIMRYGGWIELCNNNTDEWWSLHERNFINAYRSAVTADIQGPEYLQGILEIDNLQKGLTPDKLFEKGIEPCNCGFLPQTVQKYLVNKKPNLKILDAA